MKLRQTLSTLWIHILFLLVLVATSVVVFQASVKATEGKVLIVRAQLAGSASGTSAEEFIILFNNSDIDINVTNWCVTYNGSKVGCITSPNAQTSVFIKARSSMLLMNPALLTQVQLADSTFKADGVFNSSSNVMAATNGSLQVISAQSEVMDTLGWGSGIASGTAVTGNVPAGKLIQRKKSTENQYLNVNNNSLDFEIYPIDSMYDRGGLYEYTSPIDLCLNTPDTLDLIVPVGFIRDESGNCYEDQCDNLSGLQANIPAGYSQTGIDCFLIPLLITELLPNVVGTDTGNEFVEIYNPNTFNVELSGYGLQLVGGTKKFTFAQGTVLQPYEYLVLSDTKLGFSLPNTSASVRLSTPAGMVVHESTEYLNPKDDTAWALFDGAWQYTSVLTPGSSNELPMLAVGGLGSGAIDLVECGEGKYRNPETNRCKNIESAQDGPKTCAAGQERNPETNRCRKIGSSTSGLALCNTDQERNPETNRCRKIGSGESDLKPCTPGQERNLETNRCRKAATAVSGTPLSGTANPAAVSASKFRLPIMISVVAAALGYGAYEYRNDLKDKYQKVKDSAKVTRPPE